jgi:hypothetical protein
MLKPIAALLLSTSFAMPYGLSSREFSARQTVAAPQLPLELTAYAVSLGGPRTSGVASPVDLTIDRWSSPAETARLVDVLKEQGPEKLLDVLRDMKPVGSIRVPGNLAYDLHYAHQESLPEGGRRIFLATDRPISYWEVVNRPRSINYPFTFIELRLDSNGKGEGKLALATKINASSDGEFVQLENYAAQPIQLNEVRVRNGKW